jgi:ABC-type antimicrobial peptide transport system permease subunit
MGVVLAAIGIYGVVGFLVAQRTQEIGVRMALGASPKTILKMIMANVARWTVAGALLGLLGSWYAVKLLQSLLFQVSVRDPWPAGAALALLLLAAFVAAWIPARRAMRIDPIEALRYE